MDNISKGISGSFVLPAGKYFIDMKVLSAYTSAVKRQYFISYPDWARRVRDQCARGGVPFYFKQHGGRLGRILDGRTWDEHPEFSSEPLMGVE